MNILIVTPHFYPEDFRINDLAYELKNRSHDVTVLTAIPDYPEGKFHKGYGLFKKNFEIHNGINIYRSAIIPRGSGRKLKLILNYTSFIISSIFTSLFLLKKSFDIIFIFAPSPITVSIPAIFIKKIKKIPICLWIQDLWPESVSSSGYIKSKSLLKLLKGLVKYIYKNCDKIMIPSKGFKSSILKIGGVSPNNIEFIPNWAEKIFKVINNPKKELKYIPNDSFKIMFAGNLGIAQDFNSILLSAKILKEYKNIQWLVLGQGSRLEWIKKKIKEYELNDCFHLLGRFPMNDMPQFFSYADAMLFSLKSDEIYSLTIPSKVQSYLACGKPILGMIDGEASQLIKNSKAGLSCPAGDYVSLSKNILKMKNMSKEQLKKISFNSLSYYKNNFDREIIIDKIEIILFSLFK